MVDNHLMFLVTLPFHDGCMKVRERPFNKEQAKNIYFFDLSAIFARKLQKSHLKPLFNNRLVRQLLFNGAVLFTTQIVLVVSDCPILQNLANRPALVGGIAALLVPIRIVLICVCRAILSLNPDDIITMFAHIEPINGANITIILKIVKSKDQTSKGLIEI